MNKTHNFSPVVLRFLTAGVILLFLLGFAAMLIVPQARFNFGRLILRQESHPETVGLHSSNVNAEGLAIYRQSERDLASPRANVEGMTIYHKSEWGTTSFARTNEAGLDIYWQSERRSAAQRKVRLKREWRSTSKANGAVQRQVRLRKEWRSTCKASAA